MGRIGEPHGDYRGRSGCLHQHTAAEWIMIEMSEGHGNRNIRTTLIVVSGGTGTHVPHLKRCNRTIPVCGSALYPHDWQTLLSGKRCIYFFILFEAVHGSFSIALSTAGWCTPAPRNLSKT